MGTSAAVFALAGAQAVNSIASGYAQKSEYDYNARMVEEEKKILTLQEEIDDSRYQRLKGKYLSKSIAAVAGSGIALSGSSLSAISSAQEQIEIDQAITKFNYRLEKNRLSSQADAMRRAGKTAMRGGYAGAFNSLMQGASNYIMYNQKTTFDTTRQEQAIRNTGYKQGRM